MVLLFFFIWRSVLFIVSYVAQHTVPYLGFFPYKEILTDFKMSSFISAFANFDGVHYILISQQGYSQYEQAYFPLYPLTMSVVNSVTNNPLASGLIISHVAFLIGLIYLEKLCSLWCPKQRKIALWTTLFILTFPTAFFFGSVYTEGLFFMLVILSLFHIEKKNYLYAALFAALSSSTRLMGVFLIIPFALSFIKSRNDFTSSHLLTLFLKRYFIILSPTIGLALYCLYLWITVGDPLFFLNAQPAFGANRSTSLVLLPQVYFRYLKILFTATRDFQWYVSFFEMTVFTSVIGVLLIDLRKILFHSKSYLLLGVNIFSFVNIILPTLTGTFSSVPRYALFSLSMFLCLAHIHNNLTKKIILVLFMVLQITLLSLFIQGYFIG